MKINKANNHKNSKIVDHEYKVGYKGILNNNYDFKPETQYKRKFEITQYWIN